jgi:hypothetical protein
MVGTIWSKQYQLLVYFLFLCDNMPIKLSLLMEAYQVIQSIFCNWQCLTLEHFKYGLLGMFFLCVVTNQLCALLVDPIALSETSFWTNMLSWIFEINNLFHGCRGFLFECKVTWHVDGWRILVVGSKNEAT